jgi:hypothetical protein
MVKQEQRVDGFRGERVPVAVAAMMATQNVEELKAQQRQ